MTTLTNNQIILGIDPGTNLLGFGVIAVNNGQASFLDMGVLDFRSEPDHFAKLKALTKKIIWVLDEYHPDVLAIESPFVDKNPQVMLKLGRAQGVAITEALLRDIPVFEYAPRKAKIAITGNGNASKEQVAAMIQSILGMEFALEYYDATDALAIAMCHFYASQSPVGAAPPKKKSKKAGSWAEFIESNPDRVVKK